MAIYDDLIFLDILGKIAPGINPKPAEISPTGVITLHGYHPLDDPWLHTGFDVQRDCGLWQVWSQLYSIVPKECRACWKIVWEGRRFDQLWRMMEVQKEMGEKAGMVCKCGREGRYYSGKVGFYRAFWYTPLDGGLKGARKLYKEVADWLAKEPLLAGENLELKRGCTEFERMYNPSDTWDDLAKKYAWDVLQMLCDSSYTTNSNHEQAEIIKTHVKRMWIEWAWQLADKDVTGKYPNKYLEESLENVAMSYQRSIHSEVDYEGFEGAGQKCNTDGIGTKDSDRGGPGRIITDI